MIVFPPTAVKKLSGKPFTLMNLPYFLSWNLPE